VSAILLVQTKAGPAPSYVIEKAAAVAEVHLLLVRPLPASAEPTARRLCASVIDATGAELRGEALVDRLVAEGERLGVGAIVTFAEFALLAVTEASARLGLRGVGPNVRNARDKYLMRGIWRRAGVPVPEFRQVRTEDELRAAFTELRTPFLLKAAWGAGSIGQVVIGDAADLEPAWRHMHRVLRDAATVDMSELRSPDAATQFVAEEMIPATTESWYDSPGYGDYVSVEGVVVDGEYRPVCVTGRLPTIEPFTDLGTQSPCALPEPLLRSIVDMSRRAVDALGLHTCGTHTEIKLLAGQELCVVETGARFGGGLVVREAEAVWGVDLIGALIRALLGRDPGLPEQPCLVGGREAAASVVLIGANSRGEPWRTSPPFDPAAADWARLLSPGSSAQVVPDHLAMRPGDPMPVYDGPKGVLNFGGFVFLRAKSTTSLLRDAYAIIDNLERVLGERAPAS
jgi:biotin carboxylase